MSGDDAEAEVLAALRDATAWLPHQGPLSVFVHHNPLEAHEALPFAEALRAAADTLGAEVRLGEAEYERLLADGRIEERDLEDAFRAAYPPPDPAPGAPPGLWSRPEVAPGLPSAEALARTLLRTGLRATHWRIRAFRVAEGEPDPVVASLSDRARVRLAEGARRMFAEDPDRAVARLTGTDDAALGRLRLREQHALRDRDHAASVCMRDDARAAELGFGLLAALARRALPSRGRAPYPPDREAVHRAVDEVVLPVVASALDRGQARLRPAGGEDLLATARVAIERVPRWRAVAAPSWRPSAAATVAAAVRDLPGLEPSEGVRAVLFARPGWAGALAWRDHHAPEPLLPAYVAARTVATLAAARALGVDPVEVLRRPRPTEPGPGTRGDRVAQLLARHEVDPTEAVAFSPATWSELEAVVDACGPDWRRAVLQEAREATHVRAWLGAVAAAAARPRPPRTPRVAVLCCIDDREESLRRAIEEELGDEVETYGLAGHFQLAIQWRGVDDVAPSARHPVLLRSTHRVVERPLAAAHPARPVVGWLADAIDRGAVDAVRGAVAALVAGPGSLAASTVSVLWPETAERWRRAGDRWLRPPPSELVALRGDGPGDGLPVGFSPAEAAERVGAALRTIGLAGELPPVVVVLGHTSSSRNNPFASAYECGACGGSPGGDNARAFARLANDPAVRGLLAAQGLHLPPSVRFVGGVHDTGTDEVRLFADAAAPDPDPALLAALQRAADRDAEERGRRFLSADPGGADGRREVARRCADWSEVRPEYCHATNALLVVGPRDATRGLFLDRRALLHSYDPGPDASGEQLRRLLAAAVPVSAGINLEYYFSRVDPERFGAGTKLPHNVVGLHGLMNGSLGDLRTGLPLQTVEIHEPVRLLVVVAAPRERVAAALSDPVRRLADHGWIHLAALDADGVWRWKSGGFVPADAPDPGLRRAPSSAAWYRGRHDALAPALVAP